MKKIIKEVDKERGVIQVTIADERWYLKQETNEVTGIPEYIGVPSVTWITQSYPKGIAYFKWLADKGWDESEAIKVAAGDKGSKVHLAIEKILAGEEVRIDSKFMSKETGQEEELTLEECDCILSFKRWYDEVKPKVIASERVVMNNEVGYGGTIDLICTINGESWIIDFKTSQNIWPSHELQLSAYNACQAVPHKLGILQVGYRRNKSGFKFTEVEDKFKLFLVTKEIWESEHGGERITKKDYPIILSPATSTLTEETKEAIKNVRTKAKKHEKS